MASVALPAPVISFDSRMSALLGDRRSPDVEALTSFILDWSSRESVKQLIEAVCSDEKLAERCFRSSVAHPLGFDKYLLLASSGYQLRLHVWWPDSRPEREDIHNHRYSFASGIVAGVLRVSSYETCRSGTSMLRFKECRHPDSSEYQYEEDGKTQIRQAGALELRPGSGYYMRSTMLHRVDAPRHELAATLFLRFGEGRGSTSVIVDKVPSAPASGVRASFSDDAVGNRIRSFLEYL